MFALCENHEFVKTLKECHILGFLRSLVYSLFSILEHIFLSFTFRVTCGVLGDLQQITLITFIVQQKELLNRSYIFSENANFSGFLLVP